MATKGMLKWTRSTGPVGRQSDPFFSHILKMTPFFQLKKLYITIWNASNDASSDDEI